MNEMKPIETHYRGRDGIERIYRSRLEARWAVFFDFMAIAFEYEPQGFEFDGGVKYLPDFWLPQVEMWAEVKPALLTEDEMRKANLLAEHSKHDVLLLIGKPDYREYYAVEGSKGGMRYALCHYHGYYIQEQRFPFELDLDRDQWGEVDHLYPYAIQAANSARFEHGQQPNPPLLPVELVQDNWGTVVAAVGKVDPIGKAILKTAYPQAVYGDLLTVGVNVPDGVSKMEYRIPTLKQAIAEVFRTDVKISIFQNE